MTSEQQQVLMENYGKVTRKKLAEMTGLTVRQISYYGEKLGLTRKLNRIFELNETQKQILLSGKIGDGNFKLNKTNYYYRECHSIKEKDYLLWKFNNLGDLTSTTTIRNVAARTPNSNPQQVFNTVTTPTLKPFADLTIEETIPQLNQLGLILLILDDGWWKDEGNGKGRFGLSCFRTQLIRELLIKQYNETLGTDLRFGNTVKNAGNGLFRREDNEIIVETAFKYFSKSMDIIQKKFRNFL